MASDTRLEPYLLTYSASDARPNTNTLAAL